MTNNAATRLNIYLRPAELREKVRIAAARRNVSLSDYCLRAIHRQLVEDGLLPPSAEEQRQHALAAAAALDELRGSIGPIGIPVASLIAEGRRR